MPPLTEEGRALIDRVPDADLRADLFRWLSRVQIMEEIADDRVTEAMSHAAARAEPQGNVLAWRGRGN